MAAAPGEKEVDSLCIRKYPTPEDGIEDKEAEEKMSVIMDAVTAIRSIRGELNISPSLELRALIRTFDSAEAILNTNITYVKKLAKAKDIEIGNDVQSPKNAATAIKPAMEIFVPLKGLIDIDTEINRLNKELARTEKELMFVKKKLANEDFISKAPRAVVEENKARHNDYVEKLQGIRNSIEKLEQWGKPEG